MLDTDLVNGDGTHFGIGASYTFDAITVHANYGEFDYDTGSPISADRDWLRPVGSLRLRRRSVGTRRLRLRRSRHRGRLSAPGRSA
jgi:hypothetical protein